MAEARSMLERRRLASTSGPILIVDDDAQLQRTMRWLLEDEGLRVETASNGDEALARAGEVRPSLIILDLNLPARDGESVAEELRGLHGHDLPIIVVSSDSMVEERATAVRAVCWIVKPFEIDELVSAVWEVLGTLK
ncbi:MAG TPA: response regulator [Chloroflexota bacterium]